MNALHPWIGSDPQKHLIALEQEASQLNLLTTISYVAIGAISVAALAIPFVVSSFTVKISACLICSALATPVLAWVASTLQTQLRAIEEQIQREAPIVETSNLLHLKYEGIALSPQEFRNEQNAHLTDVEILPVVARIQARDEAFQKIKPVKERLIEASSQVTPLRLLSRNISWIRFESEELPLKVQAAFARQVLKNPFLRDQIQLVEKNFAQRTFDREYGPDDTYVILAGQDGKKRSFSLNDVQKTKDSEELRRVFFENV